MNKINAGEARFEITENVRKIEGKTPQLEDIKNIAQNIRKHPIFFHLNEHEIETILKKIFYCEAKNGENIFN